MSETWLDSSTSSTNIAVLPVIRRARYPAAASSASPRPVRRQSLSDMRRRTRRSNSAYAQANLFDRAVFTSLARQSSFDERRSRSLLDLTVQRRRMNEIASSSLIVAPSTVEEAGEVELVPMLRGSQQDSAMTILTLNANNNRRYRLWPDENFPMPPPTPILLMQRRLERLQRIVQERGGIILPDDRHMVDMVGGREDADILQLSRMQVAHWCADLPEEDPFVGVFKAGAVLGACCPMQAFLELRSGFASPVELEMLSRYGERLNMLLTLHDIDLAVYLLYRRNDYSRLKGIQHADSEGVQWIFSDCDVCAASLRFVQLIPCCQKKICQPCWSSYIRQCSEKSRTFAALTGVIYPYDVHCFSCSAFVPYLIALGSTETSDLELIRQPGQHPSLAGAHCPVCLDPPPTTTVISTSARKQKGGIPVRCSRCGHEFCAACGAEAHLQLSCKKLMASATGFQLWSKQQSSVRPEFRNGRHCPGCGIPVTHGGGCPHMTCGCGTHFCFLCGHRIWNKIPLVHGHNSTCRILPIVSCPARWKSRPKRIAVHTIVSVGLVTVGLPLAAALLPVAGTVALSILGIRALQDRARRRRQQRHN